MLGRRLSTVGPSVVSGRRFRASALARAYACRGLWLLGEQFGRAENAASISVATKDLSGNDYPIRFYASSAPSVRVENSAGLAASFDGSAATFTNYYSGLQPAAAAGGFIPVSLLCVTRPATDPGGALCIFNVHSTDSSGAARYGIFRDASQGFTFDLTMDGSNFPKVKVTGLPANDVYAVVATTRSKTDHEIVVCNLRTGAVSSATSSTASGAATLNPTWVTFGAYIFSNNPITNTLRYTGEINLGAVFESGLTSAQAHELARAPFALVESVPVVQAGLAVAAVSSGRGARIISSGYWAA